MEDKRKPMYEKTQCTLCGATVVSDGTYKHNCPLKPDQQPNDVEAVKPIGYASDPLILHAPHENCGTIAELEDDSYRGNLYSQQTIDQLQEKIEAERKAKEEAERELSLLKKRESGQNKKVQDTLRELRRASVIINNINNQIELRDVGVKTVQVEVRPVRDFLKTHTVSKGEQNDSSKK